MMDAKPNLAIGTTPVVQKAKELSIPALYFTNLISAQRAYEMNSRVITTSDQMLSTLTNLR